jgi:hypothetical protein
MPADAGEKKKGKEEAAFHAEGAENAEVKEDGKKKKVKQR